MPQGIGHFVAALSKGNGCRAMHVCHLFKHAQWQIYSVMNTDNRELQVWEIFVIEIISLAVRMEIFRSNHGLQGLVCI
jgi:hypothetical protein